MQSSYLKEDVEILLKDITNMVKPLSTEEREKRIQQGVHYSEMLPIEYKPSDEYKKIYNDSLIENADIMADAVSIVSEKIFKLKQEQLVLISLARAGIPIGILIKRYLKNKYKINIPHYAISIIRGRGIDNVAMEYILNLHPASSLQFVDGWIGKGAILNELKKELNNYENISNEMAVVSDPAGVTKLYGTQEDFLIPSSCLNATVSGLISRTFLNKEIIFENDFHGAAFYKELLNEDVSYEFINIVESKFNYNIHYNEVSNNQQGLKEVEGIAKKFNIKNINFVKPGIGETTRVLLRRVPHLVLVKNLNDTKNIKHILRLSKEKQVKVIEYPLINYKTCGLIKDLNADV